MGPELSAPDWPTREAGSEPRWSAMELKDLEAWYLYHLAEEMRASEECDRHPLDEPPKYRWVNRRYPGFVKRLQREWGLSVGDFHTEHILEGDPQPEDQDYDWGLPDEPGAERTEERLNAFFDEFRDRGYPETTIRPLRSRLKRYIHQYMNVAGTADLLAGLRDDDERPTEIDRAYAVSKTLTEELGTAASARKYLVDVRWFYRELESIGLIKYNPLLRMESRLNLDLPEWDNPSLNANEVKLLSEVAVKPDERMVVIGLCGWGLRPSELASLHRDQVVLDPDEREGESEPFLDFREGDRKNGPGTVPILVGVDLLQSRIEAIDDGDRSPYIFPSDDSKTGHVHVDTIRKWLKDLAKSAEVRVKGEKPTPRYARRWWYTEYGEAAIEIADRFDIVADEQGSESSDVVLNNYLSGADRRKHLRETMASRLSKAFPEIKE